MLDAIGLRRVLAVSALVVFAHPKSDSPAGELLDATVEGLSRAGHDVNVLDLYREGFEAAMTLDEWRDYPTSGGSGCVTSRYADVLGSVDLVAFVFPMWWSGPPSILKGFFDRILVPGIAFNLDDTGKVKPALRHVRRVVVVTAAEPPGHFPHRSTRQLAHSFARSLRRATGWRTRTTVVWAGPSESTTAEKWVAFTTKIRERLAGLR